MNISAESAIIIQRIISDRSLFGTGEEDFLPVAEVLFSALFLPADDFADALVRFFF
ncbi:hypothetical protein GCWU000342_01133 [Shuttleworthella satelles DSM 14600]|uniref:Uncharacterized protein n=1 Tax=Shuttleworthella satelles DSM 14600 TaxID=626523 RepID=C4GB31_9FIRM|nr:hypothetical protein GCWU000342_01133 [Shuttleworthia satelles DSM 14600]